MLRSLYSGISGMRANQTKMDVVGNNIANVGTTAFKSSRARFQDMLSQSVSEATAPSTNQGGINASQVGLGVQVAGIDTITKQGMMQPTSRNLDMAVDGDGYFLVGKGESIFDDGMIQVNQSIGAHNIDSNTLAKANMDLMYTRDGSFTLDSDGNLLTSDGYRVMGFSLTNDSTLTKATTIAPNSVSTNGLTFQFGPGAALNGYHIELGTIGAGTTPSASVDKNNKKIILNGDFSAAGALTADQAQIAINKALSYAGIAQTLAVSGKPNVITGITSSAVSGGADDKSPSAVSAAGFTVEFSAGTALNGYSIELGTVSAGTTPTAHLDSTNKKIIVDGDFTTPNAMTTTIFKDAINQGLATAGITQLVTSVSGASTNINGLAAQTDTGSAPNSPTVGAAAPLTTTTLGGLTLNFGYGSKLNGYHIKLGTMLAGTSPSVNVDTSGKIITINADFTTIHGMAAGAAKDTAITNLLNNIKSKFNTTLAANNISHPVLDFGTPLPADLDPAATDSEVLLGTDGVDLVAPKTLTVGGMNFAFPNGTMFNDYTIELGTIATGTTFGVNLDTANKKITINGDFISPNAVTATQVQNALKTAITNAGTATPPLTPGTAFKSDGTAYAALSDIAITVTGAAKNITGISSRTIDGGTNLAKAGAVTTGGFSFQPTDGAALNDYKIVIGTVAAGTEASASVDTTKKTITVNGDFTVPNGVTSGQIANVINTALESKGIMQAISVTGTNTVISDFKSNNTNGGTPVQSIKADGTVSFVDGTKTVNAYDESLKSLKIPDKIHDDAANIDLRVRTFSVGKDGVVSAVLEDGRVTAIGQLAMATFKNPAGLTKLGKNLYHGSVNSGDATLRSGAGTLGEDNSKGYGDVLQGMLEMSNVDLAEQFTDMIVTSRAFQASSKVITTGDEILQDILNLKR